MTSTGWLALAICLAPAIWPSAARAQPVLIQPPGRLATQDIFDKALADFDQAQQSRATQPDRARQLFRSAAQGFETIAAAGGPGGGPLINGRLEFNLANSYLQASDVGRAILHYRRARRLIPRDEPLRENLKVARSRCLTSIGPTRRSAFISSVFFWHFATSKAERAKAAIGLYVAFWSLLTVRNFVRKRGLSAALIACAVLATALGVSVAADRWFDRNAPPGVVTAMDVVVRKGPGDGYQRQFEEPLQPGVEFTLRERRGDWWHIDLPDGQAGWIDALAAELIATS